MALRGWIAWFADGKCYGQTDALPREGVVCIVEYEEADYAPGKPYRTLIHGGDWYWIEGGRWQRAVPSRWDSWLPKPNPTAVRSCARIPADDFDRIVRIALEAPPCR